MLESFRWSTYVVRVGRSAAGLGLYARQDIPAGKFVIEYGGPLVREEEGNRIGGKYLFDLENGYMVLGGTRKNIARYINHACRPNCEIRFSKNHVYVYSAKKIKAGDELTYDYGKEYFNEYIKPYGCRCLTCVKRRARTA